MPPKYKLPPKQRLIVEVNFGTRNSKYRIEKPKRPLQKWKRNHEGRLVSNLPSRPNLGGRGDLECFYHVEREDGKVLPPPQALWMQRRSDEDQFARYRPVWDEASGNLTDALRRRSQDSEASQDFNGKYGLPYLFVYDEDMKPDEQGEQYRRWRPLQIVANGGNGVVISYVDERRGFSAADEIGNEDKIVAKFNFKEGDLVGILASVISDIGVVAELFPDKRGSLSNSEGSQHQDDEAGASGLATQSASGLATPSTSGPAKPSTSGLATPSTSGSAKPSTSGLPQPSAPDLLTPPVSTGKEARRAAMRLARRAEIGGIIRKFNREIARSALPTAGSRSRAARSGRRSSDGSSNSSGYLHLEKVKPEGEGPNVDSFDMYRLENQILEMLEMTGSPHFPKMWKLADPPQNGTLCTMEYIPGARTISEQFDLRANKEVHIRLIWEMMLCLSKALSVMAYGSEDPAPSHRVHGWNEIVHLDWSTENIFVRLDQPSHTCSHGVCFMVGDFGFALVVPNSPKARAAFRLEHLKLNWHKDINVPNERLPEAQIDTDTPLQQRIDHPVIGHFSYKTNIFNLASVFRDHLGGVTDSETGHKRYKQDNFTPLEQGKLYRDLETHLPVNERCGEPLIDDDAPQVRGYLDVAESLIAQPVVQNLRVSKQRFVELIDRCLEEDPAERPEIEEIMLSAARGMAEAGIYVPPPPSSESSTESDDDEGE